MRRLRVLVVEDLEDDALIVERALRRGFDADLTLELERVQTADAMREALEQRGPWDVVISDWSMPMFSALGALAIVREAQLDIPFIVVSGTIADDGGVEAM